ncbi:hypothetical protein HID58_018336, partial [Brassica napus]
IAAMSRPCGGASESQFLQNAREVIIQVGELVRGVFGSRSEKRYWFRGENLIVSIYNNHFLGNEDRDP